MKMLIYSGLFCCLGLLQSCSENKEETYENPPMEETETLPGDGLINGHDPDSVHMEEGRGSND